MVHFTPIELGGFTDKSVEDCEIDTISTGPWRLEMVSNSVGVLCREEDLREA